MTLTKPVVKYIAVTTLSFMAILLLIGPIYFYLMQDPNFFSAFMPTLGVMLCLKGKIADYCLGSRDKHKPRYILGGILIAFTVLGGYASITADKVRGDFEQQSLFYLLDKNYYSLFVGYVSLSVMCLIVVTITNIIKFRKKDSDVAEEIPIVDQAQINSENYEAEEVYELPELPRQFTSIEPVSDAIDEESTNSAITLTPPPVEEVVEVINNIEEDDSSKEIAVLEERLISGEPPVKEFNVFVKLAIGIFILFQILSIFLDISVMRNISGEENIQLFRLCISVANILLIISFIESKHIVVLSISIVLSIIQMFQIDLDALSLNTDVRDAGFNLIYFLCMFSPLLLTLFFDKNGISGWDLIMGKYTSSTQEVDGTKSKISDSAIIEKAPSVGTKQSPVKTEEAIVTPSPAKKSVVESAPEPVVKPAAAPVVNPQLDRYTRLCHAISPANFVNPYSPKKVKVANELLEALIKNKDNEVVISLIEEKAKKELGIKLDDNE